MSLKNLYQRAMLNLKFPQGTLVKGLTRPIVMMECTLRESEVVYGKIDSFSTDGRYVYAIVMDYKGNERHHVMPDTLVKKTPEQAMIDRLSN